MDSRTQVNLGDEIDLAIEMTKAHFFDTKEQNTLI